MTAVIDSGCNCIYILGSRVDLVDYTSATKTITEWARTRQSTYVCVTGVHGVMESYDDPEFREILNHADMVTPDGVPLVWAARLLGHRQQSRVYGPDLTLKILEVAERERIPVGFYGSSPATMSLMLETLLDRFPRLVIDYTYSPPFRPLTDIEQELTIEAINLCSPRILFIGLGCPKQERWMAAHKGRISSAMIGVGAAFDFIAGTTPQAPRWLMGIGCEWLFRLATEPRRLWKRYPKNNPRFVVLCLRQLILHKLHKTP